MIGSGNEFTAVDFLVNYSRRADKAETLLSEHSMNVPRSITVTNAVRLDLEMDTLALLQVSCP